MMWFLPGPCGSNLGTVPASCGFLTHREPSLVHVLPPGAGSLVGPFSLSRDHPPFICWEAGAGVLLC
jgi:hypothetical protein